MACSAQHKTTGIVRGILLPTSWNRQGQITGVLLAAFDERNYYLEENPEMEQWLDHLTRTVKVHGSIRQKDGVSWINVTSLEPVLPATQRPARP